MGTIYYSTKTFTNSLASKLRKQGYIVRVTKLKHPKKGEFGTIDRYKISFRRRKK